MPPDYVSRNGVFIAPSEACVSIFNPAIYGAYGVYESLQIVDGVPFEQEAHLQRLAHSAAVLGFPLPASLSVIGVWMGEAVRTTLAASHPDGISRPCSRGGRDGARECTLRLFVIGTENGGEAAVYIWLQPPPTYPAEYYAKGASAVTFEAQRYLPEAKSLNTLTSFMAQREARTRGVHEGLLHHAGCLTEGSNSNLFAITRGHVITPAAEQVLSGVTRDIVVSLARQHDIPVVEAPLPLADVLQWDEAFITSTSRHVMPLTEIDGRPVGSGGVGPTTRRLMALFESYFAEKTAADRS